MTRVAKIPVSHGIVFLVILILLIPIFYSFGIYFQMNNLLLEDISTTRDHFEESSSPAISYLYNWLIKAIVPIVLIYFLIRRKHLYALLTLSILLYLYIISGNKLVYITAFVVLFFFFVGNDYFQKIKYLMIVLLTGIVLLVPVDLFVTHSHALKGIFVMRMLFLPAELNYYYFDFFRDNPLYFAESNLFRIFVHYPYHKPIGYVISEAYFNYPDMNANNGIIGDGFMNLGYWGVALNIGLISTIFLVFNSLDLDARYLGIFFVMVFLLLSVPMLSMFITSGLWIIFLAAMTIMAKKSPAMQTN